jgi:KDO2-lipid IV(A) lauroyltransferase
VVLKKFFKRKFERYLVYLSIYLLILIARATPRRVGMKLFSVLGRTAAMIFRHDRRKAMHNLSIAFPKAPAKMREAMMFAMYKTLGQNIYEYLNLQGSPAGRIESRIDSVENGHYLRDALDAGKGVIAITGHIGCWELLAAYLVSRGHSVSVVARQLRDDKWQEWVGSIRSSLGVSTIIRDNGAREMLDVLRNRGILGVLMDQNTRLSGYYVPFFGRPAHTSSGAAKLAAISGAPIVPMAIYLSPDAKHVVRVLKPIDFPAGCADKARAIESVTAACAGAIEELIRLDPKQWIWWHDRWEVKH